MIRPKQLPLPLPVRAALGREDYFVSRSNGLAVALLDDWQSWPNGKMILVGPAGAGKTHLAHVWAAETGAAIVPAADLPGADIPALARGPICVEDADRSAGDRETEEALFHLYNRLRDGGRHLLVSASCAPRLLPVILPDLASRLSWGVTFHLSGLDDAQRLEALKLRARDHGLALPDEVARYILHRGPRSLPGLFAAMSELDNASLSAQRKLTIPFLKETLGW